MGLLIGFGCGFKAEFWWWIVVGYGGSGAEFGGGFSVWWVWLVG